MAEPKDNSELGLMRVPVGPAGRRPEPVGRGWLVFAGTMVLTAATADAVLGIAALAKTTLSPTRSCTSATSPPGGSSS